MKSSDSSTKIQHSNYLIWQLIKQIQQTYFQRCITSPMKTKMISRKSSILDKMKPKNKLRNLRENQTSNANLILTNTTKTNRIYPDV